MKFYKVYNGEDIGFTETFFPTKKDAKDYFDLLNEDGDANMDIIESRSDKASICDMINNHVTR